MNLSYNGKSCEANFTTYEATEIEQTGHVLGKSHKILQGKVAPRQTPLKLQYHGRNYNA